DGVYEFETADDRFAYEFTAFAASGMPIRMLTIDPSGRFVDVTGTRLDLVRADAKQWWSTYVKYRGTKEGDVRGLISAWCADQYRLGQADACNAELANALKHHWLGGPAIWPSGTKFIALLHRDLSRWGYVS